MAPQTTTRFFRTAAAALLAALGVACVREPDPFTVPTDDVAVHAILEAGSDSATAIIERPGSYIEDAVVRLIQGGDTTVLPFQAPPCTTYSYGGPPSTGCHRARLDRPVEPGSAWELEVVLPDGARITGSTVVPPLLAMTAPQPGARLTVDCNDPQHCFAASTEVPPYYVPVFQTVVRWSADGAPGLLFAHVRAERTFLGEAAYDGDDGCMMGFFGQYHGQGDDALAPDSMVVAIPNIACEGALAPGRFDSIHAEVRVHEWNPELEAYVDALSAGSTAREAHLSAGIQGAWGVFGAVTPTGVPITLVRDPAPAGAPAAN